MRYTAPVDVDMRNGVLGRAECGHQIEITGADEEFQTRIPTHGNGQIFGVVLVRGGNSRTESIVPGCVDFSEFDGVIGTSNLHAKLFFQIFIESGHKGRYVLSHRRIVCNRIFSRGHERQGETAVIETQLLAF